MPTFFQTGFEAGDPALASIGVGSAIQSVVKNLGVNALKAAGSSSVTPVGAGATKFACRFYLQIPALPGALTNIWQERIVSTASRMRLRLNAANQFEFFDTAATLGLAVSHGTLVPTINTFYWLEAIMDLAAGGVCQLWANDVLDINATHSNNVSGALTDAFAFQGAATPNEYFFDDIKINTGTVAKVGAAVAADDGWVRRHRRMRRDF